MKTTVRRADRFSDERSLRQIEAPLPGQDTAKKKKKRNFKHPCSYRHKTHFCATAATSNPEGADAKTLRAIRTFARWCRRAQPITTLEPGRSEVIIASWIIRSASTKEDGALSCGEPLSLDRSVVTVKTQMPGKRIRQTPSRFSI